jgi:hypothetical protein
VLRRLEEPGDVRDQRVDLGEDREHRPQRRSRKPAQARTRKKESARSSKTPGRAANRGGSSALGPGVRGNESDVAHDASGIEAHAQPVNSQARLVVCEVGFK